MTHPVKHRHAADTGYPRGEQTRLRIIRSALKLFGERGFDGASTRAIAARAGVNTPALQYYFDSKEGLYTACVEHIAERVSEHLSGPVMDAERALASQCGDDELIEAFCVIQSCLAELLFTSQDADAWRLFTVRQQAGLGENAGFRTLYERVSKRMLDVMASIVGHLLDRPADDEETLIRALALNSELMVIQVTRQTALARLKSKKVDAPRLDLLKRIIREHTSTLLHSMSKSRAASGGRW
jgi:TetR/AcrR family transcriptional regulator, regulator of cefoperazone and chloramphenicol sensitivity